MWRCFQPFSNCRKGGQEGRVPTMPRRRRRGETMRGMPSGGRGGGEIGWPGGRGRRGGMQVALPAHWLLAGAHVGGRGGVGSLAAGQGVGGLWQPAAAPDVARLGAFAHCASWVTGEGLPPVFMIDLEPDVSCLSTHETGKRAPRLRTRSSAQPSSFLATPPALTTPRGHCAPTVSRPGRAAPPRV